MSHLAGDHTADLQGITVVRPFLQFEKRHMQDYCTANAVPWVEDPTNSNPAYMRTRHRIELAGTSLHSKAASATCAARSCTCCRAAVAGACRRACIRPCWSCVLKTMPPACSATLCSLATAGKRYRGLPAAQGRGRARSCHRRGTVCCASSAGRLLDTQAPAGGRNARGDAVWRSSG